MDGRSEPIRFVAGRYKFFTQTDFSLLSCYIALYLPHENQGNFVSRIREAESLEFTASVYDEVLDTLAHKPPPNSAFSGSSSHCKQIIQNHVMPLADQVESAIQKAFTRKFFGRITILDLVVVFVHGGRLTSDAGVLLLREVDRQVGLIDGINEAIPDPRDPRYTTHQQREMIAQRIFSVALGYEDLNDQQTLRDDPALQTAADKTPEPDDPLASPPTLCRLENRIDRKTLAKLMALLVERFLAAHDEPPDEIVLDLDATDDPVHGQQEKRFFHGYYRHYCFLPLYVFCGGHLLCALLRPANIDAAKHSRVVAKLLVERIRREWPNVKIIFRGDSGFCRRKLMRWCEKNKVDYIFGIGRNKVLERRIAELMDEAEAAFKQTGHKQRRFGETQYAAGTWDRERRVIMKAERLEAGPNRRFVVTSLSGEPQALYDGVYTQRGDMENRIKEQQLMLFADRTSCHDFEANQFRLLLSSFAYVLLHALRTEHLAETELATAQVNTIRLKLLKIAARVTISVRRVMLHLSSSCPYQSLFRTVAGSVTAAPG